MLEAEIFDTTGRIQNRCRTSHKDWFSYNADGIWSYGELDTGGGHYYVNENIDAGAFAKVSTWRTTEFDPTHWVKSEARSPASTPVAKTTLPLVTRTGLASSLLLQLSNSHYSGACGKFGTRASAALCVTTLRERRRRP